MRIYNKFSKGFTLIEMSMVILVLTMLTVGLIGGFNYVTKTGSNKVSSKRMDKIEESLVSFLAAYGRLPCPSIPTLDADNADFGREATVTDPEDYLKCNEQRLRTNLNVGDETNTIYLGAVPVETLGLEPDYMYDGFGNKFSYVVDRAFVNSSLASEQNLHVPATNPYCDPAERNAANGDDDISIQCFAKQLTGTNSERLSFNIDGDPAENIYSMVKESCRYSEIQEDYTRENYCSRYCGSFCHGDNYQHECYHDLCHGYCTSRCDEKFDQNSSANIGLLINDKVVTTVGNECLAFGALDTNFYAYTYANYCSDCSNYCTYQDFSQNSDIAPACRTEVCKNYCGSKCYDLVGDGSGTIPNFYYENSAEDVPLVVKSVKPEYNTCITSANLQDYSYQNYCAGVCSNFNQNQTYQDYNGRIASCFAPLCNVYCNAIEETSAREINTTLNITNSACKFLSVNGSGGEAADPRSYCKPECFYYDTDNTFASQNPTFGRCFDEHCTEFCALYKDGDFNQINYGNHGNIRYYPKGQDNIVNTIFYAQDNQTVTAYTRLCNSSNPLEESYESYCKESCASYCENGTYSNPDCVIGICDEYCANTCQDLVDKENANSEDIQTTDIIIRNSSQGAVVSDSAVYVLISHGKNGLGAFSRIGRKDAPTDLDEQDNTDCNDGNCGQDNVNDTFVLHSVSDRFDDMIRFETRSGMVTKCNERSKNICSDPEHGHNIQLSK